MVRGHAQFRRELATVGVRTAGFGGILFTRWTCVQLRKLIRLFNPRARFSDSPLKADLCLLLVESKPGHLSHRELRAVHAISYDRSLEDAVNILTRRATNEQTQTGAGTIHGKRLVHSNSSLETPTVKFVKSAGSTGHQKPHLNPTLSHLAPTHSFPQSKNTALQIEQSNGPIRHCQACDTDLSRNEFTDSPKDANCEHELNNTCNQCFTQFLEAQADSAPLDLARCPELGCRSILNYDQMKQHASRKLFTRYDEFITRKVLEQQHDFFACANHACKGGGFVDETVTSFIICPDCDTRTCTDCDTEWHPDVSHDDNLENRQQATNQRRQAKQVREEEMASLQTISMTCKACPNAECGVRIEKDDGCDHMTCLHCDHEFCWLCLANFDAILREGNEAHASSCKYYPYQSDAGEDEANDSDDNDDDD